MSDQKFKFHQRLHKRRASLAKQKTLHFKKVKFWAKNKRGERREKRGERREERGERREERGERREERGERREERGDPDPHGY